MKREWSFCGKKAFTYLPKRQNRETSLPIGWRLGAFRQCLCGILLLAAVCARAEPSPSKTISDELGWSSPPIKDANPSIRHAVAVQIPTALKAAQRDDWLIYGFSGLQTTNLMVGYKMATGVDCEGIMDFDGVRQNIFREGGPLEFLSVWTNHYNVEGRLKAMVESGAHCAFEYQVTVFETDIPGQHHWVPKSGKLYKVLWTHTFRKVLK